MTAVWQICLAVPIHILVLCVLGNYFQGNLFYHFPRDLSEADWLVASWILLLTLTGHTYDIQLFPGYRNLPLIFSGMIYTVTLTSCINTLRLISSGPMDLCVFNWLKCFLTVFSAVW